MLHWNCNFNIPDSTIQVATATISVVDFKIIDNTTYVDVSIEDASTNIHIKYETLNIQEVLADVSEIESRLLQIYQDSQLP
jgi:hypothetical protein